MSYNYIQRNIYNIKNSYRHRHRLTVNTHFVFGCHNTVVFFSGTPVSPGPIRKQTDCMRLILCTLANPPLYMDSAKTRGSS